MDTRLNTLADFILKGLVDQSLSNAVIYEFADQSCSCIREETELQWDGSLGKLWEYVSGSSAALECAEKNECTAFQLGRIFAMLELLKLFRQKQTDEESLEDDAKEYGEHWRPVFSALSGGKSMTHGALAETCNLSDSSLSQFLHRIEDKQYIQSRKVGRTKYYRLSSRGRKLLERMPPKREISMRILPHNFILKEINFGQKTSFENLISINLQHTLLKKADYKEHYSILGIPAETKEKICVEQ